jgi:hypothetical protein
MASSKALTGGCPVKTKKYKKAINHFKLAEGYAFKSDKKRPLRLADIYSYLS